MIVNGIRLSIIIGQTGPNAHQSRLKNGEIFAQDPMTHQPRFP